ncbi:MAG: IS1634 family transposase [Proteobacteria bacterium]|nr:IS1634 family transposase [Pseudomonadota bacterium]
MYVERVPNRGSRPAILLREGWREGGKVRKRTIANLSDWPAEQVEALRAVLKGGRAAAPLTEAFDIVRSRPHGHVAAVLGTMRQLRFDALLGLEDPKSLKLCEAMIAARVLFPGSKLATARGLGAETLRSTLGEQLDVEQADEDDLYAAMDALLERQEPIEQELARRHLGEGAQVLYDLTSAHFEGRCCPLAKLGYSRDGHKGKPQIEVGLLGNAQGCPVAVEVFEGNVGDPRTLGPQIRKLRERFALSSVVLVGDRGMLTEARIREELRDVEGLDWISALRAPAIQALVQAGSLQLSLFDERDLGEVHDPRYPEERLIVCRNPLLATERARKRQELLAATERELDKVVRATARKKNPLRGKDKIGLRVGKLLGRFKVGKHFVLSVTAESFRYTRDEARIAEEAALDGIYVLRTSVATDRLSAPEVVRSYKQLASVERAFRSLKTVDLKLRPIYHHKENRVRAHVLLCMLAYYLEWHMRQALAPILFDDDDKAHAERTSPVAPAVRSARAQRKAERKRTDEGATVHSFQSLLADLATLTKNRIQPRIKNAESFDQTTLPTNLQRRALDLLGVTP